MKRFLLILSLCFASVGSVYASNPSEEWKAYRIARITANGKSSQEKVQIWSDYLAKYPNGPYRERALEELDAASRGAWRTLPPQTTAPDCSPSFDLDAALGVSPAPVVAPMPALTPADRLQVPSPAANKRPLFAGLRSVGFTYAGSVAGSLIAQSTNSSGDDSALVIGGALMATSFIVGPSMGHLYAGDKVHARKMIALRALAGGAVALGALQMSSSCDVSCSDNGLGLVVAGATAGYALVMYDFVDSFFTVQRMQGRSVKSRLLQQKTYAPSYRY